MTGFSFSSLRVRLLLLVLLAVIPALGLILYTASEQRRSAAAEAKDSALRLARSFSSSQDELIESARQLLTALTQIPAVRDGNTTECNVIFASLLKQYSRYNNFVATKPNGDVFCSAVPSARQVNLADRPHFQFAVRTGGFAIADYLIARTTGKPILSSAYPVLDASGQIKAVVFAGLDLDWLNALVAKTELPAGATLTVIDRKGTVLARFPHPKKWVGKSMPNTPLKQTILSRTKGTAEATGMDGVVRLYGFSPLGDTGGAYVNIGIPKNVAFVRANSILTRNLVALGIVGVLALVAAWFGSDFFVLRQVNSLTGASKRLSEGDLSARTGLPHGKGELTELARTFDEMAGALQTHQREAKQAEEALQARYQELQILQEISQTILNSQDLQSVLEALLDKTLLVGSFDQAVIRLSDTSSGMLLPVASRGYRDPENVQRHRTDMRPGRLRHRAMLSKHPIVVENVLEYEGLSTLKREGVQSAILVPVRAQEEIMGVIQFGSRTPRIFRPEQVSLLESVGNQMGVAIQKARLLEESQQRAQEQAVLNAIAMATSQAHHLEELFEIVLGKVLEVTGRERVTLRLKDPVTGEVTLAAHRGFSQEEIETLLRRGPHKASEQVFASGEPLVINDPAELSGSQSVLQQSRSIAWIPMKTGAKIVGVLGVSTSRPVAFSSREVDLLRAIGNVVGVALENARLFEETQQRNRELQALYTVSNKISRSVDIGPLMQAALVTTIEVLKVDAGRLYVFDGKINALRLAAHWGVSEDQLRGVGDYAPGEGVIGRIFVENRPFVFADVETDPNYQAMARGKLAQRGSYRSVAGLPITIKDRPVGVIYLYGKAVRKFTPQDIELLSSIGDQIGVAVENARLFQEIQGNLERVRALRGIDQAITSTLDLDAVLNVLLQKIDLVLPYSATTVRLFNKQSGLLEPVACRNLDEEEWKAKQWRAGRGVPNVVFETRAPVRINNVQTDPRNKDLNFFRKHGLVSYLGAPLIVQGEVLGVISFYTKEEHEFSNEEIEFLTMLAGQAAIAIHNSQLYQEMVSLAAKLSRSNKARDEFLSVMSHELRTPLNVVMGYTGMIRDGLLGEINPEQEKALEKISSRARDQLTMISSILQATQLVAEGVKADRREVSLKDFLDDLRSSYSIPLGKEVSVIWDYSLDLPVVHTDAEKLKHVLQNLIDNAIKFTERGHVTISARIRQQATGNGQQEPEVATHASPLDQLGVLSNVEGRLSPQASDMWVEFKVSDTGIGIAEENFLLVFERFRQVDSSETRRFGGVGIGLYIVRKFTELLGGTVEVESEPGKGSTFTVTIPVADHQEAGKEEASERVSSR